MINIFRLLKSFKHAAQGLRVLLKKEQNFRVHVLAGIVAILLGFYFHIKIWEWCLLILMITLVMIMEMLNTVFERLSDLFRPRMHDFVMEIKDLSSAMVLVASIVSVIIGLIIFLPYFLS